MWMEIFRAGTQRDGAGVTHAFSEADLDKIIANYDPTQHEAPVVIGHPRNDAPAYGWVEGLKREGTTLLAKVKDLAPELKDLVTQGRYKKRSIALYPGRRLKHVGFLGAVPPAIKGLADVQFSEAEEEYFEFGEDTGDEDALKTKDDEIARLKAQLEELQNAAMFSEAEAGKKEFGAFCDKLTGEGRLTPAQREHLNEFMEAHPDGGVFYFNESNGQSIEGLKKFLSSLPVQITFGEMQSTGIDYSEASLTYDEHRIAERLGVTPEAYDKARKN